MASITSAPASSSTSRTNTYPLITTAGIQTIPNANATSSASHASNSSFPIAAIAVISIVGGLVAIFIAYRLYVWSFRRYNSRRDAPLPQARPTLSGQGSLSPLMPVLGGSQSQMSMAFADGGKRSASSLGFTRGREASWGGESWAGGMGGEKDWSPNGSSGAVSPGGDDSRNGSRGSLSGGGMTGMHSSASRASMSSSSAGAPRRNLYGANAHVNGPQLRSLPSSTRLSGAPHAPHSRIDIIPPLPLAPPPGQVISTDKSTLDFAPSSGIGREGDLVNLNGPFGEGSQQVVNSFPPPHQQQQRGRRSPSGSATPASSSSNQSSPHRPRGQGQGHLPTHSSSSSHPSTSSGTTSSSAHPLPSPINTNLPLPSAAGPTSPLDKLQQRIAQEARRDAKARERSERVRRANEGEDGTRSGSGSDAGR